MYFQTLDDKSECVGIYKEGVLYFDETPSDLLCTWRHSGSIRDKNVKYAYLYAQGKTLEECCPIGLQDELRQCQNKFKAYLKSFMIAKVNMRDHCIFDLIPHDFLLKFCEIKNQITKEIIENYEEPTNYQHLDDAHRLLHKIKNQKLNLSSQDCRHLLANTRDRQKLSELIKNYNFIDYNLFGTVTGRLTTSPGSFPMLTLKKELREIIKPNKDLFVALDYNGAEVRTLLELCGNKQPEIDIHVWNSRHLFEQDISREECKVRFFAWLYEPTSKDIETEYYDREKVLKKWYKDGHIHTPYGRQIQVEQRKALNYLLQSTTSDRVISKAVLIDQYLQENKCHSHISHIVHDELVLDYSDKDRAHIENIKDIFEDGYPCNLTAGKNYYDLKELKI